MADNISRGRIMAGFARGVPREYKVYDVPMAESRARFDEALAVILRAWTGGRVQPPGQVLEVQGHRDLAAALSAAASAGVDPVHRLEGDDRVRGGGQFRRRDPPSASRRGEGHDRVFRQEARRKRPPHQSGPDLHDDRGLGRRQRRARRSTSTGRTSSTSTTCCGITAAIRRGSAPTRSRAAMWRRRPTTMCGRRTRARR